MTDPAPSPSRPLRTADDRLMRSNRIFARMLQGHAYADIAAAERLTVRRVRGIVKEALDRREFERRGDYARQQIARLEGVLRVVERKVAEGERGAVPMLVRVVDRVDRYRGWAG